MRVLVVVVVIVEEPPPCQSFLLEEYAELALHMTERCASFLQDLIDGGMFRITLPELTQSPVGLYFSQVCDKCCLQKNLLLCW